MKPVESDEEAIIEYLGNVTPDLKHDALKLIARIRADEREEIARFVKKFRAGYLSQMADCEEIAVAIRGRGREL